MDGPVAGPPRSIREGARNMTRHIAKSREGKKSQRHRNPNSNAFSGSIDCDYEDRKVPAVSSSSQQTAENLRKLAKLIPTPKTQPA